MGGKLDKESTDSKRYVDDTRHFEEPFDFDEDELGKTWTLRHRHFTMALRLQTINAATVK